MAALALVLAAVGIYGVVSYSLSRRLHEMGIRLALGALPDDVLRLMVQHGMAPVLVGTAVGAAAAAASAQWMESLFFQIQPLDPLTFAATIAALLAAALVACIGPARRAARVDPLSSLRCE